MSCFCISWKWYTNMILLDETACPRLFECFLKNYDTIWFYLPLIQKELNKLLILCYFFVFFLVNNVGVSHYPEFFTNMEREVTSSFTVWQSNISPIQPIRLQLKHKLFLYINKDMTNVWSLYSTSVLLHYDGLFMCGLKSPNLMKSLTKFVPWERLFLR